MGGGFESKGEEGIRKKMSKNEFTVNVKNLIYRVLLKWRMILIFALVFAILGNCYGIYKSYKASKVKPAADLESQMAAAKKTADSEKGYLSATEVQDMDNAVEMYRNYQHSYDAIRDYLAGSVVMQLDYDRVPTVHLRYFADDHYSVEYPQIQGHEYGPDIAASFTENLLDEETLAVISDKTSLSPEFAWELIDAYSNGNYICIDIIGIDEGQCRAIADVLKDRVEKIKKSNASVFPKYDLAQVADSYRIERNESVYEKQNKKIADCNSVIQCMMDMQLDMTERQANYFAARVHYLDLEESQTAEPVSQTAPSGISLVNKKFILLGFAGGAFLAVLIAIVAYVLTPVVRVKENLTNDFGGTVLGTIWTGNEKKKFLRVIDRLIGRWFYGRESEFEFDKRLDMISAGIEIAVKKEGLEKIYLTGASEKNGEALAKLKERLTGSLSVGNGECVVYSPASLKELSESDAVVFIETAGDSRFDEVAKELELAAQSKVNVLGFVLIQQ